MTDKKTTNEAQPTPVDNLAIYDLMSQPPKEALKEIKGGRIKGMTDINPQWRYRIMTQIFGMCGIGWRYEVVRLWSEPAPGDQIFAFALVNIFIKVDGLWSEAIQSTGGSMLVEKESSGLHANDEGYKMATTDALSTGLKMLGVAAAVYAGQWDGSKYKDTPEATAKKANPKGLATTEQLRAMGDIVALGNVSAGDVKAYITEKYGNLAARELPTEEAGKLVDYLVVLNKTLQAAKDAETINASMKEVNTEIAARAAEAEAEAPPAPPTDVETKPSAKKKGSKKDSDPVPPAVTSTSEGTPAVVQGNLTPGSMDWFKASLEKLEWADVGGYLTKTYKVSGSRIGEMVKHLTPEQLNEFTAEVTSRLETLAW